ncbi:MAG: hypothetical protein K2P81_05670 [Bacteriovoracaceae bacterium]|nr:hypothetical protein [Bacteriovoracaceae bacterium]
MRSFAHLLQSWVSSALISLGTIIFPGICALFLIDLNFNVFRGEFSFEDMINFNKMVEYYVAKLDVAGQETFLYIAVMAMIVYLLGYFLNSSSKFFTGTHKFHRLFQVGEYIESPTMTLPVTAKNFLNLQDDDLISGAEEELCQSLIASSDIPSKLGSFERRSGLYRCLGYLFCFMVLLDIGLFVVAFDFEDIVLKMCVTVFNIAFAFLFFKGHQENVSHWKEQLNAETLIAVKKLSLKF